MERLDEIQKKHRLEEFKAVCRFINTCELEELSRVLEEIRCCHDNLFVFNDTISSLDKVESVSINGDCIQLNLK